MQVVSDMDVSTRLSGASLNLFYASWNRLLREVVRRIVTSKRNDSSLKEFYGRCANRGVPESFIRTLDVDRTRAVRSIGNGSYANRLVALRELQGISGSFDDVGRKNLTRDIVATRVGHDLADRYAPQLEEARPTVDNTIVFFENDKLMQGSPVPVVSNQVHSIHLQAHVPALMQLVEQLNEGAVDPVQALPALQAFYQHIAETAQYLAADPNQKILVAEANQALQYAEEMINNTSKHVQKLQREQRQPESEGGDVQQEEFSIKQAEHEMKMQMAREKASLDMEIKRAKFQQEQAERDARNVLKMREIQ
jgi:hypothetical protein